MDAAPAFAAKATLLAALSSRSPQMETAASVVGWASTGLAGVAVAMVACTVLRSRRRRSNTNTRVGVPRIRDVSGYEAVPLALAAEGTAGSDEDVHMLGSAD